MTVRTEKILCIVLHEAHERQVEETIEPLIRRRSEGMIVSQTLRFAGISEEALVDEVRDLLGVADPTVAPLVGPGEVGIGEVDLRVTTRALTREEAEKKIEPIVQEIISRLSGYYLGGGHE
jgi:nicotinamide-nucleotide amidase